MIKKILKIRENFFDYVESEKKLIPYRDLLYFLCSPRKLNLVNFFPKIFLRLDYSKNIQKYKSKEFSELLEFAKSEAKKIIIAKNKNNPTIVLIHPFYLFLRHINLCYKENAAYHKKVIKYYNLMTRIIGSDKFNIILIDTPDNFLFCLNIWKNAKVIDIRFTEHKTGTFLDKKSFSLNGSFIGGTYLGHCIDDIISQSNDKDYILVPELVLFRPTDKILPNIKNYNGGNKHGKLHFLQNR